MAKEKKTSKKADIAEQISQAVGAGREVAVETVDFSNPQRPKTCLEVDFPIIPVNNVAIIEGNAGKPIYQMSKWWARRRSSIFRSILLAAAMKAPKDQGEAAKKVWEVYYANHQKKGTLSHLRVADIFMGGGTTLVEGSRLGMQMHGNDLNPVAWLIVKNELAQVDPKELQKFCDFLEAELKPQIMPFYACDCPRGHKGKWISVATEEVMDNDFDPCALSCEERKKYRYEGPEIIYTFWVKHGPCQVTGCGHRTPIVSSPVIAVKQLTVKAWSCSCPECQKSFDIEQAEARMAPGVPLILAQGESPYSILTADHQVTCPHCNHVQAFPEDTGKARNKKIELTLLIHPQWLKGSPGKAPDGSEYGGSAGDSPESTDAWNSVRASSLRLLEVRGKLPDQVTCPETGITFATSEKGGNVPRGGELVCTVCGTRQKTKRILEKSQKTAPVAAYAIQGFCPQCDKEGIPYCGRFFSVPVDPNIFYKIEKEWENQKTTELKEFYPKSEIPFAHVTHQRDPLPAHGFTHWWKMFHPRQLLILSRMLKTIVQGGDFGWPIREFVLGAFQQYLRNQNMFCFWNIQRDTLEPFFSNNNYHPKAIAIENSAFGDLGRGNWKSCMEGLQETLAWAASPWEIVSPKNLRTNFSALVDQFSGKSGKVLTKDSVFPCQLECVSSSELSCHQDACFDLVITDPPFGDNVQYAELSDFFYVWLRLALKNRYPDFFPTEYTPKALETVANKARHPENPDEFYQKLLTACWREAHRILKSAGMLAFTFHHSEDEPWLAVLESLFQAGFYLVAAYPIRSDETKGEGEFGSQKIEYDIIHVCRKRIANPKPLSWAGMRRQIVEDLRQIKGILDNHHNSGLPDADLKVIKRGKALEYYSRHYGEVYLEKGRKMEVKEAMLGINQILDDELTLGSEVPPREAEPLTRQFLRLFDKIDAVPRDQMQKFLRGTGIAPDDFVAMGWCREIKKIFVSVPLLEIAQSYKGKPRKGMLRDYDQAGFFIGACLEESGINMKENLDNHHFKLHPALPAIFEWMSKHGMSEEIKVAADRANRLYARWMEQNKKEVMEQMKFFDLEVE